jgi:hypothetical protein
MNREKNEIKISKTFAFSREGTSCEKCAEGYGRPHPLIGIYLGQCWSCRSVCHERSDRCDRETGKCLVRMNSSFFGLNFICWFFLNRIVKVIVKVIDVNDVMLVMYSMHEAINVYEKININNVKI